MKSLYQILILILLTNYSCKSYYMEDSKLLKKAVLSNVFNENFNICNNKDDDIRVFNDTKYFNFSFSKENNCSKKIFFSRLNFKYNINSNKNTKKGIVFYKFKNEITLFTLYFLDIESNGVLILTYDKKLRLIKTKTGSF